MPAQTNLKSMSIDKLMALRDQIEATLASKVAEERRNLQSQLATLCRFKGAAPGGRGAVAAKYRNPENPSETWAGRGLKPRWLVAAIKAGHEPDDFLIAAGNGATKSPAKHKLKTSGNGPASMRGSSVAPKYRNPDNPSETWAGRGLKPRWLTAALKKSGKKLEHFSIAAPAKKGPSKVSRKVGKK